LSFEIELRCWSLSIKPHQTGKSNLKELHRFHQLMR